MIDRVVVLLLAGCVVFGSVILVELTSEDVGASASVPVAIRAEPATSPRAPGPRVDDLQTTILARPLFSPTRLPAGRAGPDQPAGLDLADVRLTGIVIEPERHLAIFAVPGAKPMVRSEGETMKDWRLDSITAREVVLSGPAGTRTLQPKIDTSFARPAVAPPRLAPVLPPAQSKGPGIAPAGPPGATPLKPASMPAARPPGTAVTPVRPPGAPRERQ
jgi:hypothetical protein